MRGLTTKKNKLAESFYKTKTQLKQDLPDNADELKDLTAKLLVEKTVLGGELRLSKKLLDGIPENCQQSTKPK